MANFKKLLNAVTEQVTAHPIYLFNCLMMIVVGGGEQIFENKAFECPKDPVAARKYTLWCATVPCVVLLLGSMLVNSSLWRVWDGCCMRSKENGLGCCTYIGRSLLVFLKSLAIPSAWVFILLLDGDHYVCYKTACYAITCSKTLGMEGVNSTSMPSGTEGGNSTSMPSGTEGGNSTSMPFGTEALADPVTLKYESQIVGWIFLLVMACFAFMFTCCTRCCKNETYVEAIYADFYRKSEKEKLEKKFEENAGTVAQQTSEAFFLDDIPKKGFWEIISMPVSADVKGDTNYYTQLHKWFDKHGRSRLEKQKAEQKEAEEAQKRAGAEQKRAEAEQKRAEEEQKKSGEELRIRAEEERERAEEERKRAEEERKRAEKERKRAEKERKRAEEEQTQSDELRIRAEEGRERADKERKRPEVKKKPETVRMAEFQW